MSTQPQQQQQPRVQVIAGGDDRAAEPTPLADSVAELPPAPPEAGPDPDATVGGPPPAPSTPENAAEALDGSLAAQLRARLAKSRRARTQEFPIPTVEGLIIVARPFRNHKAYAQGVKLEEFVAKSTASLIFVDDAGNRQEIAGGWGPELARLMGLPVRSASDLVRTVFSDEEGFLPVAFDQFVTDLRTWMAGQTAELEDELGE